MPTGHAPVRPASHLLPWVQPASRRARELAGISTCPDSHGMTEGSPGSLCCEFTPFILDTSLSVTHTSPGSRALLALRSFVIPLSGPCSIRLCLLQSPGRVASTPELQRVGVPFLLSRMSWRLGQRAGQADLLPAPKKGRILLCRRRWQSQVFLCWLSTLLGHYDSFAISSAVAAVQLLGRESCSWT